MPKKKNNHFIPRMILKYWVTTNSENRKGVYVLDTIKIKATFLHLREKEGFHLQLGMIYMCRKLKRKEGLS